MKGVRLDEPWLLVNDRNSNVKGKAPYIGRWSLTGSGQAGRLLFNIWPRGNPHPTNGFSKRQP